MAAASWSARTAAGYIAVFRSENLRRSQIAWAGGITAEWAFFVGLGVFAFQQGGTVAVGLVGLIRMLPAALVAPLTGLLGDRYRRDRVVLGLFLAMSAAVAVAAIVSLWSPPALVVYGLAGLHGAASTLSRSAQWALMPALSRTPDELVSANAVTLTTENIGTLVGPAAAGLILAEASLGALFAVCAGLYLLSAVALMRIRLYDEPESPPPRPMLAEVFAGFPALFRRRDTRLVVFLFFGQGLVRGALNVFLVIVAFQLIDTGQSGVGFLTGALGVGGLFGAFGSLSLTGRRLAAPFAVGLILWGIPLVALAAWPVSTIAFASVAVIGIGNSVSDVAGLTLLQRLIPEEVLNRALGVFWGGAMAAVAVGSIAVTVIVEAVGIRESLLVAGLFLPILVVVTWRTLVHIDRSSAVPADRLAALDRVPMFTPLSLPAKDRLASALVPMTVEAGEDIVRKGEAGDRFYIVVDGVVELWPHGVDTWRGPGEYFGEIALLRNVPRTATVRARSRIELYALDRDVFLSAVAGHAGARAAGETILQERQAAPSSQ